MSIAEKQAKLTAELTSLKNSQERFAYVVRRGRECPGLEPELKCPVHRIDGCLANVWFVAQLTGNRCVFRTDSDSAIVKGIAVVLCELYSGESAAEVLLGDPTFLERLGIDQHLTPNRRNSLAKVWGKIREFASGVNGGSLTTPAT